MSLFRRVATGSVANLAGIAMSAMLQILSVPLLVTAWGQEQFGIWMMLTTIPTYFALTDLGFAQAATTDMTINTARGDSATALATFQSVGLLFLFSSSVLVLASTLLLASAEWGEGFRQYWIVENARIIVLLVGYAALALLSRVTLAGFRATGHYALGTISYDSMVLVEGIAGLTVAYLGGGFESVAITLALCRLLSMGLLYMLLRAKVPWLYYGLDHANVAEVKRLLGPSIAALAIPIALAVNLQGSVLVVGAVLSPAVVALFVPVRTASRLVIQMIGVVNRATMPEIGRASGENAGAAMKKLLKLNLLVIVLVLVPGGLLFAMLGQQLLNLWSGGHLAPPATFVEIMALAMALHGGWYFISNILLATNSHATISRFLLISSFVSLLIFVACSREYGLIGVAIGAALSELLNCLGVVGVVWIRTRASRAA